MSVRRLVLHAGGALLHATGAFRLAHRRLVPENVCVLMYHGLTSGPLPVADGCFLRAERFAAQMEYLSAHFEVVHLEEALVRRGAPGARPIACVTFDDGFASVHDLALPILRRLRIPATVYLVTDLIDTDQTLWFARLHQAICQTAALEVRLGEQCVSLRGPAARERASAALQLALKRLERPAFSVALEDVLARLGYAGAATPPWGAFRILTSAQVRVMAGDGLVRFGAHTATHQILTRTTPDDARREIERSVAAVAALVDSPSRSFAYPNGGPEDFDATVIEAVRRAGPACAVSTIAGPMTAKTDRYVIPRYHITDDPPARFASRVHHTRHAIEDIRRAFAGNF